MCQLNELSLQFSMLTKSQNDQSMVQSVVLLAFQLCTLVEFPLSHSFFLLFFLPHKNGMCMCILYV